MKFETKLIHAKRNLSDPLTGSLSFPIYQSASFKRPALGESTGFDYSREKNPTRSALETLIAESENAKFGFAFSTGMAAIQSILELFNTDSHVISTNDLYGGTYRLLERYKKNNILEVDYINPTNIENFKNKIQKNTKAIFIETPSNPTMQVCNLEEFSNLAKEHNILVIADNTMLTPYFQQPLNLGADIVVQSGAKFLSGHNDTMAGFVCLNSKDLAEEIFLTQKSIGAILSPFDSWLMIRSIKTLAIRMKQHEKNALKIANFLCYHKKVNKVFYVGLEQHPQYSLSKKQTTGFGAVISFYVDSFQTAEQVLKKVKLISFAESFGGVESLITHPKIQTHADMSEEVLKTLGINDKLMRLSVGLENADDLIEDLDNALTG